MSVNYRFVPTASSCWFTNFSLQLRLQLSSTFQIIHPKLQDEVPVSDSLRLEKLKKLRLLPLQRSTIAGPPGLVDDAAQRGAVAEEGL